MIMISKNSNKLTRGKGFGDTGPDSLHQYFSRTDVFFSVQTSLSLFKATAMLNEFNEKI